MGSNADNDGSEVGLASRDRYVPEETARPFAVHPSAWTILGVALLCLAFAASLLAGGLVGGPSEPPAGTGGPSGATHSLPTPLAPASVSPAVVGGPMQHGSGTPDPDVSSVSISPSPATVDHGQSITLTATASGATGAVTYQWYAGSFCSSTRLINGATSATYTTPALASTTSYCVRASDSSGVNATSSGDRVTVEPALGVPSLSPMAPSLDVGQSVLFVASWTGGTPVYSAELYSSPTTACSVGSTPVQSVTTAGAATSATFNAVSPTVNTSYCVVLSDSAMGEPAQTATSSPAAQATVYPTPAVTEPLASPRASADVGQAVTFSSTLTQAGSGTDTYAWTGLPNGCANSGGLSVGPCTVTSAQALRVTLTVTDSNSGASTSAPLPFTVFSDPTVSTGRAGPHAVYADVGQSVTFVTSVSEGSGGYRYAWSGLPTGCASASTPSLACTPSASGVYSSLQVTVTDSNGVSVTSASGSIAVNSALTASIAGSANSTSTGNTVSFSTMASGGTAPLTYAWGFGDGSTAIGSSTSHSFAKAGTYSVMLWVNDSAGGSITRTWTVVVSAPSGPNLLGLPEPLGFVLIGLIIVALAGGLAWGWLAIRRRKTYQLPPPASAGGVWTTGVAPPPPPPDWGGGPAVGSPGSLSISTGAARSQAIDLAAQPAPGGVPPSPETPPIGMPFGLPPPPPLPTAGPAAPSVIPVSETTPVGSPDSPAQNLSGAPTSAGAGFEDSTFDVTGPLDQGSPLGFDPGTTGGETGIQDSKNISDGAAKGQAVDLTDQPGLGRGSPSTETVLVTEQTDDATSPGIDRPTPDAHEAGIQDSKNISDGAATGQAVDLTDQPRFRRGYPSDGDYLRHQAGRRRHPSRVGTDNLWRRSGIQDSKNISDGAAKGQAVDLTDQPGSGAGSPPMETIYVTKQADDATPPGVDRTSAGTEAGNQDPKNISDGAAKGQAEDLTDQPGAGSDTPLAETIHVTQPADEATPPGIDRTPSGGNEAGIQDSKNISDGAAMGQAVNLADRPGSEGSSGTAETLPITKQADAPPPQGIGQGGMTASLEPTGQGGSDPGSSAPPAPGPSSKKKLPGRARSKTSDSSAPPKPRTRARKKRSDGKASPSSSTSDSPGPGASSRKKLPGKMPSEAPSSATPSPSEPPPPPDSSEPGSSSRKKQPGSMMSGEGNPAENSDPDPR